MKHARNRSLRRALLLALAVCFSVFSPFLAGKAEASYTRFSRLEFDIFDTEVTLLGYAPSQEEFDRTADSTMDLLRRYHQFFDAYNEYPGVNNLCVVNSRAALAPVEIPDALFDLISWCKNQWDAGYTKTNLALGAVLSVWHDCRVAGIADPENAKLPDMDTLRRMAEHTDFDQVLLDQEARTVYFADPLLRLDVGAVAKGYAANQARDYLKEAMPSFLLDLGGNIYAGEPPMDGRPHWGVGVRNPDLNAMALYGTDILDVMYVDSLTVVTSGDYWRYYTVDGVRYHHIIDPDTLMPSRKVLSATVVCESSLLADYLSTTLFILSPEDGLKLIEGLEGVEAMWVLPDHSIQTSSGMGQYARSLGAVNTR